MPKSVFTERYQHLIRRLVEARKAEGITQVQLARQLRQSQSFVSKYERGERRLDIVEFLDVARAVGVDPISLLQEIETIPPHRKRA